MELFLDPETMSEKGTSKRKRSLPVNTTVISWNQKLELPPPQAFWADQVSEQLEIKVRDGAVRVSLLAGLTDPDLLEEIAAKNRHIGIQKFTGVHLRDHTLRVMILGKHSKLRGIQDLGSVQGKEARVLSRTMEILRPPQWEEHGGWLTEPGLWYPVHCRKWLLLLFSHYVHWKLVVKVNIYLPR